MLAFVPTMGALHDGHLDLVRNACSILRAHPTRTAGLIVSIYVNETQFAPNEDFSRYPRSLDTDLAKLVAVLDSEPGLGHVSTMLFLPNTTIMYPNGVSLDTREQVGAFVQVDGLSHQLEGAIRPHFFRGVATIVTKLLNAIQPDHVFFGQKDVQQCVVVRRLIQDLLMPTEMHVVPTTREPDGLAMSSRNQYLSERERAQAASLYRGLTRAKVLYDQGERETKRLVQVVTEEITSGINGVHVQYVALSHPRTLADVERRVANDTGAILSLAVLMPESDTRLIDNELFGCTV